MQRKAPEAKPAVASAIDFAAYRINDPEEFGRNMLKLMEEGAKVMSGLIERAEGKISPTASEVTDATKLFSEISQHWLADPTKLVEAQGNLVRDFMQLAGATTQRMLGGRSAGSGRARGRRQSFQGPGLEPQSILRLLEAILPHHHTLV